MHHTKNQCTCGSEKNQINLQDDFSLTINKHENALIANYQFILYGSENESEESLERFLLEIERAVKKRSGHIGHLKANVLFESSGLFLSLTNKKVDKIRPQNLAGKVEGVAIVFGITEEDFLIMMTEWIKSLINS